MGWAKFDDKRATNDKLLDAGLAARGLDEAAICWCAGQESDGFIATSRVKALATLHGEAKWKRVADKLCDVGRWLFDAENDGYWIHDFLEFNPSKQQAQEKRELERKKKEDWRAKNRAKSHQGTTEGRTNDTPNDGTEDKNGRPENPYPTRPVPDPTPLLNKVGGGLEPVELSTGTEPTTYVDIWNPGADVLQRAYDEARDPTTEGERFRAANQAKRRTIAEWDKLFGKWLDNLRPDERKPKRPKPLAQTKPCTGCNSTGWVEADDNAVMQCILCGATGQVAA